MKNNWLTKKLWEIIRLEYGKPLPKSNRDSKEKYPVYGANGIKSYGDKFYFDRLSIIVGRKGSAGELNLTEEKFWPLDVTYFVTFDQKKYDLKFIYNLLATLNLPQYAKGIKPGINRNDVYSIIVKIPDSLIEQKRIVKILDEVFEKIEKARSNAENNLQNSRELFESYLHNVFANSGKDWDGERLGEIANVIGGYSFKSADFKKQGRYQVIRMGNVRPGIIRQNENPVYIDNLDANILKRALILPNDIIITQTGTRKKRDYGFTAIIDKNNYLLNQRISAIRFSNNYLPKFFLYFSWSNYFKNQYFANESGTVGQGNVGINAITEAIVPFPSLQEQKSIVKKLDGLSRETKRLEEIYKKKLADLEELKKSVLQEAFSGEL